MARGGDEVLRCGCGRSGHHPAEVVSRHDTSGGVLLWLRCECGALRARLLRWDVGPPTPAPRAS